MHAQYPAIVVFCVCVHDLIAARQFSEEKNKKRLIDECRMYNNREQSILSWKRRHIDFYWNVHFRNGSTKAECDLYIHRSHFVIHKKIASKQYKKKRKCHRLTLKKKRRKKNEIMILIPCNEHAKKKWIKEHAQKMTTISWKFVCISCSDTMMTSVLPKALCNAD